jgi:hypothetical protein
MDRAGLLEFLMGPENSAVSSLASGTKASSHRADDTKAPSGETAQSQTPTQRQFIEIAKTLL